VLLTKPAMTWAAGNTEPDPLALRKIMQDQGLHMQTITAAICREDWQRVAIIAPLIADHPQPPLAEKIRILRFIGSDVGRYKNHDKQTSQAGQELKQAAERIDGPEVISAFAALQNSCLACHQNFRKPFQEYFYEQR